MADPDEAAGRSVVFFDGVCALSGFPDRPLSLFPDETLHPRHAPLAHLSTILGTASDEHI